MRVILFTVHTVCYVKYVFFMLYRVPLIWLVTGYLITNELYTREVPGLSPIPQSRC